ncbi:OadG family protein [Ructibacterium gallinarum]|uniref:OadG family protein n=1 Tax=Ructibacterium gallinarum TaxID=2779355 RepID=A0A9D5M6Y6_9FIRM|nr:OadG family protein [Ructibacterium gallinarum]MBE5040652.1 OadG family protein [Ructibacterium gallinarum]
MSLFEALGEGLMVTVIGLIIVFAVLIILMLVMMLMKVVFYKPQNDSHHVPSQQVPAPAPVPAAPVEESNMDETELIAVLTAAVAASLNTSTYHLNIKSYRRIENTSPAWNKAGLKDVIDARF